MTTAEKLALALADGTLATLSQRELMTRLHVGSRAVHAARVAAGIVMRQGWPRPHQGYVDGCYNGIHGAVRVSVIRNAVRALSGDDRIERVAVRYGLRAEDVAAIWEHRRPTGTARTPNARPAEARAPAPKRTVKPKPDPNEPTPENVRAAWRKVCNGPKPLATVAARFGLTVAQVRECVRG